jgi:hypothetical protein
MIIGPEKPHFQVISLSRIFEAAYTFVALPPRSQ